MPHTEGPWTNDGSYIVGANDDPVANMHAQRTDEEYNANISLINAAPDMLRVLRELVAESDASPEYIDLSDLIEDARSVIARATTLPPS